MTAAGGGDGGAILGDAAAAGGDGGGLQRVVNAGLAACERPPMLEIVFYRLVRAMSGSLRNFASDDVDASLRSVASVRFGDHLGSVPQPAMLAVFKAEEWDNYGLLGADSALIYSVVDVLLGGRRVTAAMRVGGRPYTSIERALAERLVSVMLDDLSEAFRPVSPARFRFERLETNPCSAAVSRAGNACVPARFRIDMEDRGGEPERDLGRRKGRLAVRITRELREAAAAAEA